MRRDKHVLLFDSDCPMCTFQSRTLSWLDWFNCVEMIPLKDPRTQDIAPDITREDLLEASRATGCFAIFTVRKARCKSEPLH